MAKVADDDVMSRINRDGPLGRETVYFATHQAELQAQYPDSFVAIIGEEVVEVAPTLRALAENAYARHGYRDMLMRHVDDCPVPIVWVRTRSIGA